MQTAGTLYVDNVSFESENTAAFGLSITKKSAEKVTIYSASFQGHKTGSINITSDGCVIFSPRGDIKLAGLKFVSTTSRAIIAPSEASVTVGYDGSAPFVVSAGETQTISVEASTTYTNFTITLGGASDASGPAAGNGTTTGGIHYAWGYGGNMTYDESTGFTITPYTAEGITYVIDTVVVDGVARDIADNSQAMAITDATSSVFATFAYTLNFLNPASGTLSVSRGGETLTSGSIVRPGGAMCSPSRSPLGTPSPP